MLKKMTIFLGVTLLPTLPVSAHRFLGQLPSITKEEAESRGLMLTFSNGGGGWKGGALT